MAWDFLQWTTEWRDLAEHADAVCFGSLAQRCTTSRTTIRSFLEAVGRALDLYRSHPAQWLKVVQTGMRQDWSWDRSAGEYEQLYARLKRS